VNFNFILIFFKVYVARLQQSQKISLAKLLSFDCNVFTKFYSGFTVDFYIFQTTFASTKPND